MAGEKCAVIGLETFDFSTERIENSRLNRATSDEFVSLGAAVCGALEKHNNQTFENLIVCDAHPIP